ncbi:MAG: polysaccharide biosynthesis tyrosine autokinase [Timaviella obliquedivisa GSE-PSE-MK23-08B]|nr:polysaccharide biosynthesis tyrosine autokinase [Timaviella obliquedivisa GSE-PSE-MK23-08B]
METEQTSQSLAPVIRARPPLMPPSPDMDDDDNLPNRGINLRSLGRTLQRQALLIAGVTTAITVAAAWQAMRIPDVYQGSFQILVEPVSNEARTSDPSNLTRNASGGVPDRDNFSVDYPTQLEILQSPTRLNQIVQETQTQFPEFTYENLTAGLEVERLAPEDSPDPTKIIKVTFEGSDEALVQKVLKVTAARYLQYSLEERKTRSGEGIKFIDDQLPEVKQRVNNLQNDLQNLQQQYELVDPATQGGQLSTRINDITTQQLETQRELGEQRVLYANLQRQLQLSPNEAIAASALSEDPTYQASKASLQEVQTQIATELARFNEEAPLIQSLRERERNILALMTEQAQTVVGQNLQGSTGNSQVSAFQNSVRIGLIGQLVTAGNQIQILEARNQAVNQSKGTFEARLQRFPAVARRYSDLVRELDISTQTLNRLQTQQESLRVETAQTEVPWELISEPLVPRDKDGNPVPLPSKASRWVLGGVALGLLLGSLLALLLEKYRNVFYSVEDIQESIQLPLVGIIPFSRGAKQALDFPSAFGSVDDVAVGDSRLGTALFREAFSDLYSNIRLSQPPIRSLMVASPEAGDGKTTIAVYLAQTAAGAGQRVLLVDTNMRQPQVHNRLDVPNTGGLSGALARGFNVEEFIQQSPLDDNLYVLTAGPAVPGSARLLGSDQMKQLMEKFQQQYDLVIYDTPHLYGLTDASFLTTQVDEILMVIAANRTNRTSVERVLSKLMTLRLSSISMVTNYLREHNSPTAQNRSSSAFGRR